jgi:hypothetical protein
LKKVLFYPGNKRKSYWIREKIPLKKKKSYTVETA